MQYHAPSWPSARTESRDGEGDRGADGGDPLAGAGSAGVVVVVVTGNDAIPRFVAAVGTDDRTTTTSRVPASARFPAPSR